MKSRKKLYFWIGTEAELMKMYRVILEAKERGYDCNIISTGQNDISHSKYLMLVGGKINIDLSKSMPRDKTVFSYLLWYAKTRQLGIEVMKKEKNNCNNIVLIVHGDTLSTLMGSQVARKSGINYMHVESGLRSHNWFSPFPEEIDRYFSSKYSVINFCQKKEAALYAEKTFKGKSINTIYNTGIEILYSAIQSIEDEKKGRPFEDNYFLVAIHRQENLMNSTFLKKTFSKVLNISEKMKCVFIYHSQTESALKKIGLWEKLEKNQNVIMLPRLRYSDFINHVLCSEFVIADGCGNQQEMYYLGKPYLIMRSRIEKKSEGIGWNAVCFNGDYTVIDEFVKNYEKYKQPRVIPERLPSQIIVDEIDNYCM